MDHRFYEILCFNNSVFSPFIKCIYNWYKIIHFNFSSLLEDAAACYVHLKPYTGTEGKCPASSFKKTISTFVTVYQKVAKSGMGGLDGFKPVDLSSCTIRKYYNVFTLLSPLYL